EAGRGIGVGAELKPRSLEDPDQLAFLDIRGLVEGHVLDEMGKSLLVLILMKRAGVDPEPERGRAGRGGIAPERIMHAVGKDTEADGFVRNEVARPVSPARRGRLLAGGEARLGRRLGRYRRATAQNDRQRKAA